MGLREKIEFLDTKGTNDRFHAKTQRPQRYKIGFHAKAQRLKDIRSFNAKHIDAKVSFHLFIIHSNLTPNLT